MEIPAEVKTTEQLQAWQAVNQIKDRMSAIKTNAPSIIAQAPPQFKQVVFMQLHSEMQGLANAVLGIRENCNHVVKSWRDVDGTAVIDVSQCVICQLYLS